MLRLYETVHDLHVGAAILRRRRYGVIEVVDGRLRRIRLRPLPKLISLLGVRWDAWWRGRRAGDRCWVYYNQPLGCSSFLAVAHVVSGARTSYRTSRQAATGLGEMARMKRTGARVWPL